MRDALRSGPNLYLRPLQAPDAAPAARWLTDPELTRTMMTHRPWTPDFEEELVRRLAKVPEEESLAVCLRADDRFIGIASLHHIDRQNRAAYFGLTLGEKGEWGKGYGTEATKLMLDLAFETLQLERVALHVHAFNAAAIRAWEKAGFVREGVLRRAVVVGGVPTDLVAMAILKSEWTR